MRAAAFTAGAALLALLALNAALAPLAREDFDAYAPIFRSDPVRWAALAEGADATAPVGVFLPEVWKARGETYRIRIDAEGERAPLEPRAAAPEARTVVCVGDSATFGWDVAWEDAFCARFANILSRAGKAHVARNLGVPGYSSLQGRIALDLAAPGIPRLAWVVIGFGANDQTPLSARDYRFLRGRSDAEILREGEGGWLPVPAWMPLAAAVEDTPLFRALARLLERGGGRVKAAGSPERRRVSPKEYEENLRAMVTRTRARGARAALVLAAVEDANYRAAAEAVAAEEGVPLIDADAFFAEVAESRLVPEGYEAMEEALEARLGAETLARDPMLRTTTDHGHPNEIGHRLIAEALAEAAASQAVDGASAVN